MRSTSCLLALALCTACSSTPPADHPAKRAPVVDPKVDAPTQFPEYAAVSRETLDAAVAGQNELAGAIYAHVAGDAQGNFAFSPSSIALAFGMTYGGARNDTATQMAAALRYKLPQTDLHAAYGTLLRGWNDDAGGKRPYTLAVANRLFGEQSFDFRDAFLGLTADHYQAELERVDFIRAPESARMRINGWVGDRTQERITNLIPEGAVKTNTRLVLTNAVYFKGNWKQAFPKSDTIDEQFTAAGSAEKVPMMHLQGTHRFAEADGVKMLELGYEGDNLAMQLLLPDDDADFAALETSLAQGKFDTLATRLAPEEVIVTLPRFTISPASPISLKSMLQSMGMTDAFIEGKADLTGMADLPPGKLFIQEAFHKAFVEVQEKGTEAAAATAVIVGIECSEPSVAKVFRADHPFVFLIRDVTNNAVLFMGRVTNPGNAR
jgi:serpin B